MFSAFENCSYFTGFLFNVYFELMSYVFILNLNLIGIYKYYPLKIVALF